MLCITVDNYEGRKYFNTPCAPTSAEELKDLVAYVNILSFLTSFLPSFLPLTFSLSISTMHIFLFFYFFGGEGRRGILLEIKQLWERNGLQVKG